MTHRKSSRKPFRQRAIALLTVAERVLAVAGVACVGVYAVACSHGSFFQSQEREAFDEALRQRIYAEHHDTSGWSADRVRLYEEATASPVEALGRLDIPDARVSVMILDGTDERTLNRAVGHIEGTPRPGEPGNVGLAGHRDGFFRGLRHLEVGDPLELTTLEGIGRYEVVRLQIVDPSAVEVLEPTDEDALTLVTCFPFYYVGDAPQRYIVHARKVAWQTHAAVR